MHDRKLELQAALTHIDERWDAHRSKRGAERAHRTLRARRRRRALTTGLVGLVGMLGLAFALGRGAGSLQAGRTAAVSSGTSARPPLPQPTAAPPLHAASPTGEPQLTAAKAEPERRVALSDGSQIVLLDPDSQVSVRQDAHAHVSVELARGRARFEVVPRPERVFRVRSGGVSVQVLGTVFALERTTSQTHVSVSRGRVAVTWKSGHRELGVSESGWFPPAPPASQPALQPTAANEASWRDPAERGDYAQAYALLQQPSRAPTSVEELLLAADAARLSGHPEAALPYLRKVIDEHAQDARAALAAFTLGGVLMQQLARPRDAEAAYARSRALAVHPWLAQDALARQVEAAHGAGDAAHARELAQEYLARYPEGRRVQAVRRFAGLE